MSIVLNNLWRHKGRTLLTMLGVAAGVAAVIALSAFGEGMANGMQRISSSSAADLTVQQRVAIARALANRPTIVLADEPTGNLDTANTAESMGLLIDLNQRQGTTLLIVTHNPEVAALARRVITFRDGRVQEDVALAAPEPRAAG